MPSRNYDLQERLTKFSSDLLDLVEQLPRSRAALHLGNQLIRSGTSPSLNYAEAMGAESRKDFIHKMRIVLKELRETQVCLELLKGRGFPTGQLRLTDECDQLISIFVRSIQTASKNT